MGIAALRKILSPAPFDPATLAGRTLAVDANNMIWSFATALAASGDVPRAPDGRPNAHLIGLTNRLGLYAGWGARSIWVFDGAPPKLKEATLAGRAERIEAARASGNAQGSIEVTSADLSECRALLTTLGVPWIVAPSESDAQCAHLAQSGAAWAAVSQDWDIALFGAPRALRNLTGSRTRAPELLDLAASLSGAGLTRESLVDAAILIGTDYNDGVHGIGPVKAVKLVRKHGALSRALDELGAAMPEADEVRGLFLSHPVDAAFAPRFAQPDKDGASALLADRGLGGRRAEKVTAALSSLHAQQTI